MNTQLFARLQKELIITVHGVRETVLAIAERVNRKVQILKLHWQASSLCDQIEDAYQKIGLHVSHLLQPTEDPSLSGLPHHPDTEHVLSETAAQVRLLKQELLRVDPLLRQIESDALREDLLRLERDLFFRSATIERLQVAPGTPAVGHSISQLGLPAAIRVVAVFRGPTLLLSLDATTLRAGDTVILLGLRDELKTVLPRFLERQRATA